MQDSNRQDYTLFAPLQPIEPAPSWSWTERNTTSNKGPMEIGGLLSGNGRHHPNSDADLRHHMQQQYAMNHYAVGHNGMIEPSQHYRMTHPTSLGFPHMGQAQQSQLTTSSDPGRGIDQHSADIDNTSPKVKAIVTTKNFVCSTCPKKFARRSDLARHERIHSGHKPHVCDFPNCGKRFIQRSALTVHSRVHTGEKPHHCEICTKPFSDSSSLARHRRTHTGKRPYRCPFANCQKTFTRRTTLTRHQNHHTGTIEQAAAEIQAKLSISTASHSYDDNISEPHSPGTDTTSPQEDSSVSPHHEIAQLPPQLSRHSSDPRYIGQPQILNHGNAIPPHMRTEHSLNPVNRHNQIRETPSTAYNGVPIHNQQQLQLQRMIARSNPTSQSYCTPQPLEPPTTNGMANTSDSPHLSALAWPSPNGALPSPSTLDYSNYPEPGYNNHMYFANNNMRRPQSTEPEDWSLRNRHSNNQMHYGAHMQMGSEWNMGMGMNVPEIKTERSFAL